jgi:DNA-binding NarL/FixJ family response regulator
VGLGVLIVDDNAPFRAAAQAVLELGGFHVTGQADTGEAALTLAVTTKPDVVLLDIGLPDMDGFAVCRALSAALPDVAVVFCSVRDADSHADAIARSTAVGFVGKAELSAARLAVIIDQRSTLDR